MSIPRKQSIWQEWRFILAFICDYMRGSKKFQAQMPVVTVYGSAVFGPEHPHYAMGKAMGKALAEQGFSVMTGGGPGLMEAANLGAQSVGRSLGCAINIATEQRVNDYLDFHMTCRHFFLRKLMLTRFSCAFIALPGGFGTLDELFEMITLVKTEHMPAFPIVMVGRAYWQPMMDFIHQSLLASGAINEAELNTFALVDSVEEAVAIIQQSSGG